jgi:hypothetical protein
VFVPSAAPAKRTFLVKQDWELKALPPESTDCIALSIIDIYACRTSNPSLHQLGADDVCLADFATFLSPVQAHARDDEDNDDDPAEDLEERHDSAETEQVGPLSGHDFAVKRYHKRSREKVLRFIRYKLHDDPEAYYREKLLLYYPWSARLDNLVGLSVNEDPYLLGEYSSFESKYLAVQSVIVQNRERYEFNDRLDWDKIQETAKRLEEADDLLPQGNESEASAIKNRDPRTDELYDLGKDMGFGMGASSTASGNLPLMRMADAKFKTES